MWGKCFLPVGFDWCIYIYEGSAHQIEIMFSDWHNCKNRFYCGLIVFPSLSLLNSISGNCCEIGWLLEEFSTSLSSGTPGLCANVPVLVFFKHECEQTLTSTTLNSLITTIKHCLHLWLLLWKGSASGTWAIWPDLPVPGSYTGLHQYWITMTLSSQSSCKSSKMHHISTFISFAR